MSKTPSKVDSASNFTSKEITTPNKDQNGISKTVFSHITNLHHLLTDWVKIRDKGLKICKAITVLNLQNRDDDHYPNQLKSLTESLQEALNSFNNIVEGVRILNEQLQALAKLQPTEQPVILTWSANKISDNVNNTYNSLLKEYRLKQIITENIAHCRDENLLEVYVSSWELEPFFDIEDNAYLFAEFGLPGIT